MKSRQRKQALAALLGTAVLSGDAAADALRCGNKIVSRGDHAAELLEHCGEPDAVRSRVVRRGVTAGHARLSTEFAFVEEVLVEEWTYNFGPRKLMRQVRLEDGFVRDVESLGYGYRR